MRLRHPIFFLSVALSMSSAHGALAAEPGEKKDAAEKLFVEGQEAMSRGEQALACARFHSSVEVFPVPNAVANVARCAERDGRVVDALHGWEQVIVMLPPGDERLGPAHERVAALAAKVPRLVPTLPAPVASITPITPPPRPPSNGPRVAAFTAGGIGVAGLVVAGITGGLLLGRDARISELCTDHVCTPAGTQEIAGSKPLLVVNAVAWGAASPAWAPVRCCSSRRAVVRRRRRRWPRW